MVDPVATPLINVGVALTSMLLNATQQQQAAAIVTDARDPITSLTQAILGRRGTKKDIERTIHKDLTLRMHEMSERCHRDGINSDRLASPCAEVEDILNTIDDHEQLLEQAVHDPDAVRALFEEQARSSRIQIDERLVPYFDELIKAVTELFITYAERSASYQQLALKHLLKNGRESREALARMHETIADVPHKVAELVSSDSKPSRVFFGSRPDVVAGERFVERNEQKHLHELIVDPTIQRTVLVGMRGCGKTQLAASLAEQCEEENWSLVAWINAVSPDTIQSDLVELAKQLQIDTSDQPAPKNIVNRLFTRLKSAPPANRLIVFDNVENIDDLRRLVPSANGLRVVATTTNNTGWGHKGWDTIKVGVFHRDESINYLLTATESTDRDAADTLAHRLGDLPLALAQAAATTRNGNLSLARYLDRLDCYRSERVIRPVPGDYYTDDVATALCMAIEDTLENLEDGTKQAARYILGALALLAESGVPTRWLDPTNEQQDDREVQDTNRAEDEAAHDALTELIHRSIVQQSADKATTMLHRLQAQVLRESWDKQNCEEAVESTAVLLRKVNIDKFRRNDTASRRRETLNLIEQLRSIGGQNYSQHLLKYEQVTDALGHSFLHADDLGLPFEALTLEVPVNAIQDLLGLAHHVSLAARNNLASAHGAAGNIDKSTEMYEQLFQDCIRILGKDHPDTLAVRNNLAYAHESAGNLDEAINMDEILLKDSMRILGKDHPDTLSSRNNLAYTYGAAGNLDKAIDMYEQLLQDSTRVLGKDHPDTLSSRNNLAGIYLSAGRITEAIDMYEEVLKDRMHILGKDHPHVLASRNNLAGAYQSVGRITEAIDMYEQLVKDSSRILGESHPDTLASRNNLAGAYHSSGLLTGAINTYGQTLSDCLRILGSNHPLTAKIHRNLKAAKRELEQQEEDSANEEREQED